MGFRNLQAVVQLSASHKLSEGKQKSLTPHHRNLEGLELESKFHEKIGSALKAETNTTAVCGFQDKYKNEEGQNQNFKLDFLIICADKKAIFHLEVKKSLNQRALASANKQLDHGTKYFSIVLEGRENWQYVRMLGCKTMDQRTCQRCQPFLLKSERFP